MTTMKSNHKCILASTIAFIIRFSSFSTCASDANAALECDLYIAESTIPNAGLGIFSGIELSVGDTVGNGDICTPILELDSHHQNTFNPYSDYVWAGEVMGMKMEVDSLDIEAVCPGLDCAVNCNLALLNVGKASPVYDEGGLHRSKDPGAGAITPYHNGTTTVLRKIPAGGELFKDYGESWFTTRSIFDSLPLKNDFQDAETLVEKFDHMCSKLKLSTEVRKELYETAVVPSQSIWNTRTINAMPRSYNEVLLALQVDIHETFQKNATRTQEWLQEYGKCVDHIVPGISTIEGAGRGAFAKRNLPNGTVITGSPLHHIPFKDTFMGMYGFADNDDTNHQEEIVGEQLLLNYCFGHEQTSMLLCPYGSGVSYINHDGQKPNVKVVWAKDGLTGHDDSWLEKTPKQFSKSFSSHLTLDYVAIRDIAEGEELFMDYGPAWDESWREHAATWQPEHSSADTYLNGHDWNEMFGEMPLRTVKEQTYDTYPATLQIRCHSDLVRLRKKDRWKEKPSWAWDMSEYGFPCRILERAVDEEDGEYVYNIVLITERKDRWEEFRRPRRLEFQSIPRNAIRFFDRPYSTDLHLRNAFRHEIGLPDELVPQAWRNLGPGASSASTSRRGRRFRRWRTPDHTEL